MLNKENYRGLIAYPPTPFTKDFKLDEDAFRENLRKLIAVGVDGVAVAGTSGEFYTMSPEELRKVAKMLKEETSRAGITSMMGAIGLSTAEAIERGQMAMEEGVDGILVIQPYYTPLTQAELIRFWENLCQACPDVGVVVYHYDWVRQPYTPDTFKRLSHIPNLIGSKEAHWDFKVWKTMHEESPLLHMSSTDLGWLTELHRQKAIGVGSLQVCWMPHKVREILDLCAAGDYYAAERAQSDFTELPCRIKMGQGRPNIMPQELKELDAYSHTAKHKAFINALGFLEVGPPRPPAIPVPDELIKRIRGFVEDRYPELLMPEGFLASQSASNKLWRYEDAPVPALSL